MPRCYRSPFRSPVSLSQIHITLQLLSELLGVEVGVYLSREDIFVAE